MYTIVPLAGPDFSSDKGVKPLFLVDGVPLVQRALQSRAWFLSGEQKPEKTIFVLRATEQTLDFMTFLNKTFPGCKTIILPSLTKGALLTALAGVSAIEHFHEPVCVDLIDILYNAKFEKTISEFFKDASCAGIIPCFEDTYEKYSYLEIKDGKVVRTVEKQRISNVASAGTYLFKDVATFFEAAQDSLEHSEQYAYKGNLFLCPSFNGLIKHGKTVVPLFVENVVCLSRKFQE